MKQDEQNMAGTMCRLSDQVNECARHVEYARIMAQDVAEYFDLMQTPTDDKKMIVLGYYAENGARAGMLIDYMHRVDTEMSAICAQVNALYESLRK